jgi:DtxR family Mn-dependent transcriptional regulator
VSSISIQDYLQTIDRLQAYRSPVSTTALASQLGVAPPSVTDMVRKLHRQGLVKHALYQGVVLTEAGEREALRLLRRHRLWELFLTEVLGLSWDEVHEEAHRLEHATSGRVADRMAVLLDEPTADPHGQQIPARNGSLPQRPSLSLAEVETGQWAKVLEVPDGDPALLVQWAEWGLAPGTSALVLGRDDYSEGLRIQLGGQERLVNHEHTKAIRVVPI